MRASFQTTLSLILLSLVPALVACSDDSEEREMIVIDIEGTWELEAMLNQDQGDLVCEITGMVLTVQMQGNTQLFGGTGADGLLTCTGGEEPLELSLPTLTIVNGRQERGTDVFLDLSEGAQGLSEDKTFLDLEGDLTGTRMEGEVQGFIRLGAEGDPLTAFQGTFVATRTST